MERPRRWRRKYLIDSKTQLRFGLILVFVLVCATAGTCGLWFLSERTLAMEQASMGQVDPGESARLAWLVNAAYFVLVAATLLTISIRWTHRFIGPSQVIARAMSRMCEGDYSGRLRLRRHDKLRDVAESAARLARRLEERRCWLTGFSSSLDDAASRGDLELVREQSDQLKAYLDGEVTHATTPASPQPAGYTAT